MFNIGDYDKRKNDFDWSKAREELGYKDGEPVNIGYYCTDRICEMGKSEKTALIWENHAGEQKKYTFNDMRLFSNGFAALLAGKGVKEGDRVCLFMDRLPELYFSFLGILKLGAVAQPLFSAFGEDSLFTRLDDSDTVAVITTVKHSRKVRRILDKLPALKHIIVVDAGERALKNSETPFNMETEGRVENFEICRTGPESHSVLHYTSGTTGKPKGALHVHSSIFSQYMTTRWSLDLSDDDIYWCTADPGWVTGTSYGIIGPWACGVTQVVLDSGFNVEKWYGFIERNRVSVWYSAPTAIRLLMKEGTETAKKFDMSCLRHLCSVGEPLNAEAVVWSGRAYGLQFHDTYWQTETGCIMISNYPGMKIKPGSMGKPVPGIEAAILDPSSNEPVDAPGKVGIISLKPGWPSMFRTYWNNKSTYDEKFINDWYLCGDRGMVDEDGYFWFVGRDDDVINTGGHLVGPFEIESALIEHEAVAEAAAVGKPDEVNMEVVKAFVSLKPGFEADADLELRIMNFIRKKLSPFAMPHEIEFMDSLPKTRSGKILRRMLRAQEWGEPIGDISTLEDD